MSIECETNGYGMSQGIIRKTETNLSTSNRKNSMKKIGDGRPEKIKKKPNL